MKTLNTFALGAIICFSGAFSQATAGNDNP